MCIRDREIYFSIPLNIDSEDGKEVVNAGDIGYWPPGKAFCLFFGPTPASRGDEIRAASPVNIFGKIIGDFKGVQDYDSVIFFNYRLDRPRQLTHAFLDKRFAYFKRVKRKVFFVAFSEYIKEKYGAEPGFFTMNLPRLLTILKECGIENPIICSSINKVGFRMCGGIEAYERAIRENEFQPIAMSVFASGAIAPSEALQYVCSLKNVRSIVFGASTKAHIRQTKELIEKYS